MIFLKIINNKSFSEKLFENNKLFFIREFYKFFNNF